MSVNEKMTAIADAIRDKTGGADALSLDAMATEIPKVYEAGKKAQHYEYWEKALYGGQKRSFNYAFSGTWLTDEIFNPPEEMTLKASWFSPAFRYAENLENINITLDLSETADMSNALYACYKLKKIKKIITSENTPWATNNFQGASALCDICFEGVIGSSISFASCSKLTQASVESIIEALKKLEEGETARTLTLHSTVKNNMTDAQKAEITTKGWTLA